MPREALFIYLFVLKSKRAWFGFVLPPQELSALQSVSPELLKVSSSQIWDQRFNLSILADIGLWQWFQAHQEICNRTDEKVKVKINVKWIYMWTFENNKVDQSPTIHLMHNL